MANHMMSIPIIENGLLNLFAVSSRGERGFAGRTLFFSFCIVLLALALIPMGVSADVLTTTQSGTVSGDLYVGAFQPVPWNSQSVPPGVKEYTQSFSIPAFTNVQWARLETVVYAAGTDTRHGQTTIMFDANGDGTYETTLGVQDQQTGSSGDATVYSVNANMDRVYSDYRIWYDVTSLVTSQTPAAYIKTENLDSSSFDGRVKEVTLIVAYNDGDSDQVKYWVNTGHDYQAADAAGETTTFDTTSVASGFTSATLKNVALSSADAAYSFNSLTPAGANPVAPINYFENNIWDVTSGVTAGSASSFGYTNKGGSFKTTIAALTVKCPPAAQSDLSITAISPNVGAGAFLFANEPNVISVTVKNNGAGAAGASTLGVDVAGAAYTANVGALAAGASQTVTITDTVLRTGGASVTITATVDSLGAVAESDETNNVQTSAPTVYNNGYKGKRYTNGNDFTTQASFNGHYGVVYSAGNSVYASAGWSSKTVTWTTTDLDIPSGATVASARLYQGYTWDTVGSPDWGVTFNGNTVSPAATYTDRKGYGTYNYPNGVVVYDVTSAFNSAGNTMTITPGAGNSNGIYGAYLVVVYQDASQPERKIWINDECDALYAGTARSASSEEATAYATFTDVDTSDVASAHAIAIISSAGDSGKSKFFMNENEYTGFWADYLSSPQIGFSSYDVTAAITSGANTARIQSYDPGTGGDNLYAQNVILIVEKTTNAPAAAFTATATNGLAPVSATFTDASTNNPVSWKWEYRIADNGAWTEFSTDQNPTFSFTTAGTYDIRLTATNAGGSNTATKTHVLSVANAEEPLTPVQSGTVSGDLYVESPTTYPNTEVTQTFTLPAYTDIQWARLYVNTYSGSAAGTYGLTSTVQLNGNTLNSETMDIAGAASGISFPLNDHVTKVYSDYEAWYDVTSLIASTSPVVHVKSEAISGLSFDGRIKGVTLVVAYNDGDSDQVKYWVKHGQQYVPSGTSGSTTFDTSAIATGWTSAESSIRYHSSSDATYTFNSVSKSSSTPPTTGGARNVWDVTNDLTVGTNTLAFTKSTSYSYKATIATLKVRYATPPTAQFTATPVSGIAPVTVQFTDQSLLATSWAWDFNNDGTVDSTLQNPSYTYASEGTYTVKLTATGDGGSDDEVKDSYIQVNSAPTVSVSPASQSFLPATTREYQIVVDGMPNGLAGYDLKVHLTDPGVAEITNVVYPAWAGMQITPDIPSDLIKIGAVDLNNQVSAGATNVVLATITIRGDVIGTTPIQIQAVHLDSDGGNPITPKAVVDGEAIVGSYAGPVAQFSATPTVGLPPLAVQFTDASTGTIYSYAWDFNNDGIIDSTEKNPLYAYTTTGTYTVKLTVSGPGGSNSMVRSNYISVNSNAPVAEFSASQTSGNYPLTVTFSDLSVGTVSSYAWDFNNDGVTDSILKNPGWTYLTPGTYSVKLMITGPGGSDSEIKEGYIVVNTDGPVAAFSVLPSEGIAPLTVQFNDQSTGSITSWAWDFNNDGVVDSTVQTPPLFTYQTAGVHTAKLTVTGPGGSTSATHTITASGLTADFTADHTSGVASRNVSFTVQFTDATTGSPVADSWNWNFGNGATSTVQNPTAQYSGRPQSFTVTLDTGSIIDTASMTKTGYISITPYLEAFPSYSNLPTDVDGDYIYEDINGNGRLDYDDVNAWYNNMAWMTATTNVDIENFDYNFNGRLDFDDLTVLYNRIVY